MDEELQQFIQQNRSVNTVKKTKSDMNAWNKWCRSNYEDRNMEDIPTSELNNMHGQFVMKIRKMNGQDYEPDTFTSLFRSFNRYLKEKGQQRQILLDREFETSRQVLKAKRKELRKQELGKKECTAEPSLSGF